MKISTPIIVLLFLLSSCSSKQPENINCIEFEHINKSITKQISEHKSKLIKKDVKFLTGPIFYAREFIPKLDSSIQLIDKSLILNNNKEIKNNLKTLELLLNKYNMDNLAIVINDANCYQFSKFQLLNIERQILAELPLLGKDTRYIFNKTEIIPFGNEKNIKRGEQLNLSIIDYAYDSTSKPQVNYWIDDSTYSKENKIQIKTFRLSIDTKSMTRGTHIIYGSKELKEDGISKWKPWRYEFNIK